MKNFTITLYNFNELETDARRRAIEEHRDFMLYTLAPSDFISGDPEHDTPEELNAVYNSEYEYILNNDEPITESIEANEYLFYCNGELANTCTYTAGELKNKTKFVCHGQVFIE